MKKIIITLGLLITQLSSQSQQFINGNFTQQNDMTNIMSVESYSGFSQESFNQWFPDNQWWGNVKYSNIGLNTDSTLYPVITVTGMGSTNYFYDVLSLELDSPLIIGQKYKIKFKEKFNTDVPITFESTYESGQYGNEIHTFQPQGNYLYEWRPLEFEFIAEDNAEYINVYINNLLGVEYYYPLLALDEFVLEIVEDISTNIKDQKINPLIKYDVYTIDGRLIYNQIYISELVSGMYILVSNNQTFKLIK